MFVLGGAVEDLAPSVVTHGRPAHRADDAHAHNDSFLMQWWAIDEATCNNWLRRLEIVLSSPLFAVSSEPWCVMVASKLPWDNTPSQDLADKILQQHTGRGVFWLSFFVFLGQSGCLLPSQRAVCSWPPNRQPSSTSCSWLPYAEPC